MENEPVHNEFEAQEARVNELRDILMAAGSGGRTIEVYNKGLAFIDELSQTHPDIGQYRLYHLLAGSSPAKGQIMPFDLPGGEIEEFIRSL